MKWRDNMISVHKDGVVGKCPSCMSLDTDYKYLEHRDGRGSLNIWCNSCKEQVHIDCGFVPRNRKHKAIDKAVAV